MKSWSVPLAAAAAVMLLFTGVWYLAAAGPDDSEGNFAAGSGTAGAGGGVSGSRGDQPGRVFPVPVHGYTVTKDPLRITLSYTIGVPECYGEITTPHVRETARRVVVRLSRLEPEQNRDVACIDIALVKTVHIRLHAPIGDRTVVDASSGTKVLPGTAF